MSKKWYTIMRDNKFYFKTSESSNLKEFRFDNIKNYPNVPFYINLWDDSSNFSELQEFLKEEIYETHSMINKFSSKEMYVLFPDDAQPIEQKAIQEFLMRSMMKLKNAKLMFSLECHHMSLNNTSYISITKTSRMFVLTYIKDGLIEEQAFLDKKEYEIEELRNHIKSLHIDLRNNNLSVYLNGNELAKYNSLGTMVTYTNLIENFMHNPKPYIEFKQF